MKSILFQFFRKLYYLKTIIINYNYNNITKYLKLFKNNNYLINNY